MSYASDVLADGASPFYELDDTSTSAIDASGNNNTATYSGGCTQSQSPLISAGKSVLFDGSTSKVTLPTLSAITGDFSVEFWQNIQPSAGYTQGDNHPASGGTTKHRFMPRPGGYYFSVWIGGVEQAVQFTPGGDVHTNKTVYWCFQRSSTSLLVFRAIVGTDTAPSQIDSLAGVATTAVDLTGILGNDPNSATFLRGLLDEYAIYSSALSLGQMTVHYKNGLTLFTQPFSPQRMPLGA